MRVGRREFLGGVAAVAAAAMVRQSAFGMPLGLPAGLQLYSVRKQMTEDLDGTLAVVKQVGFTEVEAAALPKKPAKEIRAALDKAGLKCVGTHHPFRDLLKLDEVIAFDAELGVKNIICASSARKPDANDGSKAMTLADWAYVAENLNQWAVKTKAAGIQIGYHNHVPEFAITEGKVPYEELMRLCDKKLVKFELDCGWAKVAGQDPVAIMKTHPHRITQLHVKDFKLGATEHDAKVTELGVGQIDYKPILAEAKRSQHIEHAFVEQEAFDMDWKDSLKVDADWLRKY